MKIKILNLTIVLCFTCNIFAACDTTLTNTNFTLYQGSLPNENKKKYLYNYDRLRFQGHCNHANYFATIIADAVNYLGSTHIESLSFKYSSMLQSDTPLKTQSSFYMYNDGQLYAKLYRLYGGYENSDNRFVAGLQNITMGVGRIWTPTNLFNPKNSYALESDETFGVMALSYTHYPNEISQLQAVLSQKADHSFKYAARYKTFLNVTDAALNIVYSDEITMLGYELEGNFGQSGIEVRSEGAYIKSDHTNDFFQAIIGADYGFENGITLIAEALYSSDTFTYNEILQNIESDILTNLVQSHFYVATSLSYSFNLFLDASLLYIESFNDQNSRFISPTLTYTLDDFNSFSIGAMLQHGPKKSEFGMLEDSYYFKYMLAF